MSTATAEELAEQLKSPEVFDARAAITGSTYAESTVRLFADARRAQELSDLQREILEAEAQQRVHSAEAAGSLDHAPEWYVWEQKITELKGQAEGLTREILSSALTFHVRTVPTKLRNLIVKQWTRKLPDPKRGSFPAGDAGEADFDTTVREVLTERAHAINNEFMAKGVYKVVDAAGREDARPWTAEDIEGIYENFMESEYRRLLDEVNKVSLAGKLFEDALGSDADFLSKP